MHAINNNNRNNTYKRKKKQQKQSEAMAIMSSLFYTSLRGKSVKENKSKKGHVKRPSRGTKI